MPYKTPTIATSNENLMYYTKLILCTFSII